MSKIDGARVAHHIIWSQAASCATMWPIIELNEGWLVFDSGI